MKKIMLFIAALFVLCIVPTATTLAMPRKVPEKGNLISNPHNAVPPVFNHKGLTDMITELSNQGIKDTILSYDLQEPRETTIAQSGKSKTTPPSSKKNPHVKRRGRGRSTMADNVTEKDGEDDGDESGENEEFGDDSTIKYNKGLKNSSGYNEDL